MLAAATVLGAAAAAAGCAGGHGGAGSSESNSTTVLDRLLIGQAAGYRADPDLRGRVSELAASQAARRRVAWSTIRKVIEPVGIDDQGHELPRFQTWYGKDEIVPMFEHILLGQTDEQRRAHTPPSPAVIEETFEFAAKRATTLSTFSADRLKQRKAELEADGFSSLGGNERVLMSPALVAHLLTHYDALMRCLAQVPDANDPPPSDTNFAPCVGEEFPPDAAIVKARWVPDTGPLAVHDTSAASLTRVLSSEEWNDATTPASPGPESIYTMRLSSGLRSRLVGLHITTKELRDWMWISMFWSDATNANADFGADRPPEITGPWSGYKMCTVVDYDEADTGAGGDALETSLAAALAATRGFGEHSWCSNPYLEQGPHNAKTNCIGCHQHGGSRATTEDILNGPGAFPDGARARVRSNFPADYTFVTSTGLELALHIQEKYAQLVPTP
jgi:hypothetical protein